MMRLTVNGFQPTGGRPSHARGGQLIGLLETLIGLLELTGAKVSTA